jgi:hypothetical protein
MPRINGDYDVPDGDKCAGGGSQCDNYEESSKACYVFGQKIADCNKCPECIAACKG